MISSPTLACTNSYPSNLPRWKSKPRNANAEATIGYILAIDFHGKGYATEALKLIFDCLRDHHGVKVVKAYTDTRNKASHRLAERLGMKIVETIKDADFFTGAKSDEYVFAKSLE